MHEPPRQGRAESVAHNEAPDGGALVANPYQVGVFGAREAARYLGLGVNTVRAMLGSGELDGWRSRGEKRWLVSRAACDRYIARKEREQRITRARYLTSTDLLRVVREAGDA